MGKKRCSGKDGKRYIDGMAVRSGDASYEAPDGTVSRVVFSAKTRDGEISLGELPAGAVVRVDGVALVWDPDRSLGRKGRTAFDPDRIAETQGVAAARAYVLHTAEVLLGVDAAERAYATAVMGAAAKYAGESLESSESQRGRDAGTTQIDTQHDRQHDSDDVRRSGFGDSTTGVGSPLGAAGGGTGSGDPVRVWVYPTPSEYGMKIRALRPDVGSSAGVYTVQLGDGLTGYLDLFTGNILSVELDVNESLGGSSASQAFTALAHLGGSELAEAMRTAYAGIAAGEDWEEDQLDQNITSSVGALDIAALGPSLGPQLVGHYLRSSESAYGYYLEDDVLHHARTLSDACLAWELSELPEPVLDARRRLAARGGDTRGPVSRLIDGLGHDRDALRAIVVDAAAAESPTFEASRTVSLVTPTDAVGTGSMTASIELTSPTMGQSWRYTEPADVTIGGGKLCIERPEFDPDESDAPILVQVWAHDDAGNVRPVLSRVVLEPSKEMELTGIDDVVDALRGGFAVTHVPVPADIDLMDIDDAGDRVMVTDAAVRGSVKDCLNLAAVCGASDPTLGLQLVELAALQHRAAGDDDAADIVTQVGDTIRDGALPALFATPELADAAVALLKRSAPALWVASTLPVHHAA